MKSPRFAQIYRRIELLADWLLPFVDRIPKTLSGQALGWSMVTWLTESLTMTSYDLLLPKGEKRLTAVNVLLTRLHSIDSAFNRLYVMSCGLVDTESGKKLKPRSRIVTAKQKVTFTAMMADILSSAEAWAAANGGNVEDSSR